ncbi:MAG: prolipoprotein diacylglyceryl transferase [Thermodesulfovibrionales bacterium]
MIDYPNINPEIIRFGPFAVRWYGLMYLLGFIMAYLLVRLQIKHKKIPVHKDFIESMFSYIIIGLLIGARLGYVLFYNLDFYIQNPLEIFAVWHGGMSFHGGLAGAIISGYIFARRFKAQFWQMADIVVVTAPIGLGLGRIGNFINGELYGRPTDLPWAMVFPSDPLQIPRHPSQIYECILEGVVLFAILWLLKDRGFRHGVLTSIFLALYGIFRFMVEFVRQPDGYVNLIVFQVTTGQFLSLLMIITSLFIFFAVYKQKTVS